MPTLIRAILSWGIFLVVSTNLFHRDSFSVYQEIIDSPSLDSDSPSLDYHLVEDHSLPLDPSLFEHRPTPQPASTSDPSSHQHAIIIPYRDRPFHLEKFLEYMNPYLQQHFPDDHFSLYLIEQDDQQLFNRAWLANVGLQEIRKQAPQTQCVILHDVDLVPNTTETHVPYTTCKTPMQLGRALENWGWKIPYPTYSGGITSLSLDHWQVVNGMSNDYIGWGGEDDDLYHRMRMNGLLHQPNVPGYLYTPVPRRPPIKKGAFKAISQSAEHHVQHKGHSGESNIYSLLHLMFRNSGRWRHDGLNDVYYTVTKQTVRKQTKGFRTVHHIWAVPEKTLNNGHDNPQPILELVPIPYSGADHALTTAASKAGIVWGACHYLDATQSLKTIGIECPLQGSGDYKYTAQLQATFQQAQQPWHLPSKHFADILYGKNPLEGTHRFSVVRNPYDRAIAFYYRDGQVELEDPSRMNAFLQALFHNSGDQLLLPQVDYIFTEEGTRYVHHVLRYEYLMEDLDRLMREYQYVEDAIDWKALHRQVEQVHSQEQSWLGVEDLHDSTVALLNRVFVQDFVQFNYTMVASSVSLPDPVQWKPKRSRLAPLQLLDVPYTGGEVLTKTASEAGVVWGACHFTTSSDQCPLPTGKSRSRRGDLKQTWKFRADPHQAQKPWLLPPSQFRPKLFDGNKTFAVVRNPYERAIAFYRDMYDQQYHSTTGMQDHLMEREDPNTLNTFLQNALVRFHRPHQPDFMSDSLPPLQTEYTKSANHIVRYESWRTDLTQLLTSYNMTILLKELAPWESLEPQYAPQRTAEEYVRWLQISDLEDATIDMLNRRYAVDFQQWYPRAKLDVNVTTLDYWRQSQKIPRALIGKGKKVAMSQVKLAGKLATKKKIKPAAAAANTQVTKEGEDAPKNAVKENEVGTTVKKRKVKRKKS